jgi:hypothetical protein
MFSASIVLKFFIIVLQNLPESSSPAFNKWYAAMKLSGSLSDWTQSWWPNLLFNKGYRSIMTNDDLGDVDEEFDSGTLLGEIHSTWADGTSRLTLPFEESVGMANYFHLSWVQLINLEDTH